MYDFWPKCDKKVSHCDSFVTVLSQDFSLELQGKVAVCDSCDSFFLIKYKKKIVFYKGLWTLTVTQNCHTQVECHSSANLRGLGKTVEVLSSS